MEIRIDASATGPDPLVAALVLANELLTQMPTLGRADQPASRGELTTSTAAASNLSDAPFCDNRAQPRHRSGDA